MPHRVPPFYLNIICNIKSKIDKAAFDKLSKDLQAEYVEKGGEYSLDVDGADDTGALRRAKDRAIQERKDEKKRADDAEAKLADLDDNSARKTGDIEKLDKSWQGKLDAQTADSDQKIAAKDAFISTTLVDSVAQTMAAKISTSPALILPHIKARLKADLTGDAPVTTFMDAAGNATTADALEKEFVDNKDFATIIIANKSNGGGAPNTDKRPGGASQTDTGDKPVMLSGLSGKDLAAQLKANKEANAD